MNTRQAHRLRPVAVERAREAQFHEGDEVFYGDIVYGRVGIYSINNETKPYKVAVLRGLNCGMFHGCLAYAYPTMTEYEASGVHWDGPPRISR